jgi:two-component system chemotaxis sensor kinase CheA
MIEDEALWQEFAAESEEHLDTIEAVLGGGAQADRPAVDRLFRAFHSLKGMSDALGAPGMKLVAHRCEDLLGLARNGRVQVVGPIAEGLLEAVDALRRQRALVLGTHQDAPAEPTLLTRLSALAGGEAPPEAPHAAAPPAMQTAPAGALLGALASRFAATAPLLAGLARLRDPAGLAEAEALAESAALVGLHRLAALLRDAAGAAATPAFAPALGALRRAVAVLAELAGEDAGASALVLPEALAPALLGARLAALAHLAEATMQGADSMATEAAAAEAALLAAAFGFDALERSLLLLGDLAARAAEPDGAEALATLAPHMAEMLRGIAEGGIAGYGAPPDPLTGAEAADPRLPEAWLPLLGPDARRRTLAALDAGQALYRLRMASDAPAEAEAAVAEAITRDGALLTSRTMLEAQPPHLDMLLAGPADAARLQAALAAADPARTTVLDLTPLGPAPGRDQPGGPAPRATPVTLRVRQDTVDEIIALEAEVRAAALAVAEALDEGGGAEALAALGGLARRLPGGQARDLAAGLERLSAVHAALSRAENRLSVGMRRLDEAVMELRVVPVGTLFARLPRVVRAVAQASGKDVDLVLQGEDVTIDRSLVELLADPLLHLTRNAVDHGIETPAARQAAGKTARATLRISARRRTGQVQVQVSDDGHGIDRDRVVARAVARGVITAEQAARMTIEEAKALLFRPGFSTAETVTETSGRGVGLDVVQDAARRAGGSVEIESTLGQGTTFTLRLPLTAAVQPVLLVEVGGHPYALPAARVDSVLEGDATPGCDVLRLSDLLGLPEPATARHGGIVLLKSGGRIFGLQVDRVQRRTDLLLRPLHPALAGLPGIGGVGVLGNGDPVIVLEPDGIAPAGHA